MKRRLVVLGSAASEPYAGMAWMHMQFVEGFRRLGHDVYYFETNSSWPYDPERGSYVADSDYALPYLHRLLESFGLSGAWAYRRSYSDKQWFGMSQAAAVELLASADAVFNISGSTLTAEEDLRVGRLVYVGTDPVGHEARYVAGEPRVHAHLSQHSDFVTYGENLGTPASPLPALPGLCARMRQPVLLDLWESGAPCRQEFTTVCNWQQDGEIEFEGEKYFWSKHLEFLKFIDLPTRSGERIELAASRVGEDDRRLLESNGWLLTDPQPLTIDPWPYRDYIRASRGEFTVAKDQNVRLRSGWFSERSACYLAAGRPVVTQDTGFGTVLPTGEGLFAFNSMDEILTAFEAINSDYQKHSRAAREIAGQYFRAETVLGKLLEDLGL
ncbi:conserved hypothetical protein [Candidatus Sulfopaludibacter sp. SbA4]|nr:conserved hypothetical protein [Candidatus Sulfopaludibacter sp. SbA4]